MSATTIVHPLHYMTIRKEGKNWYFSPGDRIFYNPRNIPVALTVEERLQRFRLTPASVMVELFRINGGRDGHYLTNLRDRQYYYCGTEWEDVKKTLYSLGIGIPDNAT
ncbi:MAG: hypothetical protein KME17_00545 [Cyanosarcina radialis HA8281-LM2]|jgi:hypothetical protein|nr:hypothetical protein [Cyanosarcina radialis HA8281-LM2]